MSHRADLREAPIRPTRGWHARAVLAMSVAGALSIWSSASQAQSCNGPLAEPGAAMADDGVKFKLIGRQCDVLEAPERVQHASELDIYDRGASIEIRMAPEAAAPRPAAAPAAPAEPARPLGPAGRRILAVAPDLTYAARLYGIDPLLLHAIAHVESRHNAGAVSPAGARGVMQVMPATARRFGVDDPERTLMDPHTNVQASAAYLEVLRKRYGDDLRLVLAAYNAGEGAVQKAGGVPPYPETRAYVHDVLAVYRRLTAAFRVLPDGEIAMRNDGPRS